MASSYYNSIPYRHLIEQHNLFTSSTTDGMLLGSSRVIDTTSFLYKVKCQWDSYPTTSSINNQHISQMYFYLTFIDGKTPIPCGKLRCSRLETVSNT